MTETVIEIDYKPAPHQKTFHDSKTKFKLMSAGVGSGKTATGANELIREALQSHSGAVFAFAAPTYRMLTNVCVREIFKFCPRQLVKSYNKTEMTITLINDVQLLGMAGDREDTIDRIRGLNLAGAWGDEISQCPYYMFEVLIARLRDPKGRLHLWFTTTPRGRNWLYDLFVLKVRKDKTPLPNPQDYELFEGSTLDNPYTPQEYKETMLNTYVGPFLQQELYGKFVGFEGLVYPEFNRTTHVIDTDGIHFKDIFGAVDPGFTNPSAILIIGLDSDNRAYVVDEFYEKHVTDEELASYAAEHYKGQVGRFYADSADPKAIKEFQKAGLSCMGVSKQVKERSESYIMSGIKDVSARLRVQADGKPRLFVDKRCTNTINEFESYKYPDKSEDAPAPEQPLKMFDHTMDCLRYGLQHMRQKFAMVMA